MALITCPECGKQISESAVSCPNCGYPINKEVSAAPKPQQVEVTSISLKPLNTKKKRKIVFGVLIFTFIIACIFAFIAFQNAKKATKYIANLNLISSSMLSGASDAEKLCSLTDKVWRNTIYEKFDSETDKYTLLSNGISFFADFNKSLANLFADEDIKKQVKSIEFNQALVSSFMKDLRNPSKRFEKCYDTLNNLYSAYMGFTDLAIHPSGNLQTFIQNESEKENKFMDYYRLLNTQIPNLKWSELLLAY